MPGSQGSLSMVNSKRWRFKRFTCKTVCVIQPWLGGVSFPIGPGRTKLWKRKYVFMQVEGCVEETRSPLSFPSCLHTQRASFSILFLSTFLFFADCVSAALTGCSEAAFAKSPRCFF